MSSTNWRDRLREIYKDLSKSGVVAAADTSLLSWIAGQAKYTIYVQAIGFDVTTDAAQSIIVRDTNGTPKVIFEVPASPGKGPQRWVSPTDEGVPLTEGKDLSIVLSAAGLAFNVSVSAYLKPTSTRSITEI